MDWLLLLLLFSDDNEIFARVKSTKYYLSAPPQIYVLNASININKFVTVWFVWFTTSNYPYFYN